VSRLSIRDLPTCVGDRNAYRQDGREESSKGMHLIGSFELFEDKCKEYNPERLLGRLNPSCGIVRESEKNSLADNQVKQRRRK